MWDVYAQMYKCYRQFLHRVNRREKGYSSLAQLIWCLVLPVVKNSSGVTMLDKNCAKTLSDTRQMLSEVPLTVKQRKNPIVCPCARLHDGGNGFRSSERETGSSLKWGKSTRNFSVNNQVLTLQSEVCKLTKLPFKMECAWVRWPSDSIKELKTGWR